MIYDDAIKVIEIIMDNCQWPEIRKLKNFVAEYKKPNCFVMSGDTMPDPFIVKHYGVFIHGNNKIRCRKFTIMEEVEK